MLSFIPHFSIPDPWQPWSVPFSFVIWECHRNGVTQHGTFRDWFLSTQDKSLWAPSRFSVPKFVPFYHWVIFHCLDGLGFLIHSKTFGAISSFWQLWTGYKYPRAGFCVDINIHFSEYMPRSGTTESWGKCIYTFSLVRNCKLFSRVAVQNFTSSAAMYESSNSFTSWPDFGTVSSLNFSHSNTCVVISHQKLNLHFPND